MRRAAAWTADQLLRGATRLLAYANPGWDVTIGVVASPRQPRAFTLGDDEPEEAWPFDPGTVTPHGPEGSAHLN